MSFLGEFGADVFGGSDGGDVVVTFVPSKGAVIEGYKKLLQIDENTVVVEGKNKRAIEVSGKNIEIFSLASAEIVVKGKIDWVGEKHEQG